MIKQTYSLNRSGNTPHKKTIFMVLAIIIVALCLFTLEQTNVTHFFHKKSAATLGGIPTTGGGSSYIDKGSVQKPSSDTPTTNTNTHSSNTADSKDLENAGAATLLVPNGNFVSAHQVSASTPLTSVCNTTPGATCQIIFIQNGIQKSLPSQTVDAGGSTYWNTWSPQSLGMTSGTWTVKAIALLNGQKKTAQDAMNLEIQ